MSRPQFLCITRRICLVLLFTHPIGVQGAAAQEPVALGEYDELIEPLMSESEALAWERLRTDAERQTFVDRFWEARDPTPGTEANEVRRVFELRAERASRLFAEGDVPGHRTDRGRVMIVFGLPDSQEMRALPAEGDPELVWSYYREPLNDDVRFERCDVGYELSSELDLDNRMFLASVESELRMQLARAAGGREDAIANPEEDPEEDPEDEPEEDLEPGGEAGDQTDVELADQPGAGTIDADDADEGPAPVRVSPEVQVWMQLVFGGIGRDELELRHRFHYFPASDATYAVLSFKIGKEAMTFVTEEDDGDEDSAEDEDEAQPEDSEGAEQTDDPAADDLGGDVVPDVLDIEQATEEASTADDVPGDAAVDDEAPEEDAAQEDAGEDDAAGGDDDAVDDDTNDEAEEPEAHLKIFGAVLQGERGHEDTIHRFIVPYRLRESEGDEQESPTLSLGVSLYPGPYRLAWGILDETTGNAVTHDQTFEVPDFAVDGLTLTRPLVARPPHVTDETAIDPRTIYEGMRLGRMVVQDDLNRTFGRNDIVDVILLASGWSSDPGAPGKPRLEVQYRLLVGLEGTRSLATIPLQVLDFNVLGQQIPLAQINRLEPGGDYRIEVTVKDLVSGIVRVVEAPFHLEAVDDGGDSR